MASRVLRVRMVVDIAKQSTSGGMLAASASVKTKAGLSFLAQFMEYTLVTQHNGTAVLSLAKHVNSGGQAFEMKKARDANVDLSAFGGGGNRKVEYVLITTPES